MTQEQIDRIVASSEAQLNARLAYLLGWRDLRNGTQGGEMLYVGTPPGAAEGVYMRLPDWSTDMDTAMDVLAALHLRSNFGRVLLQTVREGPFRELHWLCGMEYVHGASGEPAAQVQQVQATRATLPQALVTTCVLWLLVDKGCKPVVGVVDATPGGSLDIKV